MPTARPTIRGFLVRTQRGDGQWRWAQHDGNKLIFRSEKAVERFLTNAELLPTGLNKYGKVTKPLTGAEVFEVKGSIVSGPYDGLAVARDRGAKAKRERRDKAIDGAYG